MNNKESVAFLQAAQKRIEAMTDEEFATRFRDSGTEALLAAYDARSESEAACVEALLESHATLEYLLASHHASLDLDELPLAS